jgi:hypothetical protein
MMTGLELDALGKPLANHFLENPCYDWVLEFPKSPKRLNSPHYSYFPYGHLEKLSTNRYRTALKSRQQRRHEMRKSTTV